VAEGMSYEQMLAAQRDGRVSGGVTPVDETDRMRVVAYTDGSSRGNPGPGGYGAVLLYTDPNGVTHTKELSQGYRRTTNNRMELMGVIAALEALRRPCQVELHSDSQYVVNAFNKHWVEGWQKRGWKTASKQPVKNPDLWRRLLQAKRVHEVTFVWVKGHAGHQYNERCDELATASADGLAGPLLDDDGFEG
jgi:ribonuclease HI